MGLLTSLIIPFFSFILSLKMIVLPPIIIHAYDRLDSYIASSYLISGISPLTAEIPLLSTSEVEEPSSENNLAKSVFKPPKNDAPDDTRGAGSRDTGHCAGDESMQDGTGFQVFLPVYTEVSTERPTFLVFIPQTQAQKLFFSLKDSEEKYYYETTILIPNISGEFRFELPSDGPRIETNKDYTWSLALICDRTLAASDPILRGVIRKVEIN